MRLNMKQAAEQLGVSTYFIKKKIEARRLEAVVERNGRKRPMTRVDLKAIKAYKKLRAEERVHVRQSETVSTAEIPEGFVDGKTAIQLAGLTNTSSLYSRVNGGLLDRILVGRKPYFRASQLTPSTRTLRAAERKHLSHPLASSELVEVSVNDTPRLGIVARMDRLETTLAELLSRFNALALALGWDK